MERFCRCARTDLRICRSVEDHAFVGVCELGQESRQGHGKEEEGEGGRKLHCSIIVCGMLTIRSLGFLLRSTFSMRMTGGWLASLKMWPFLSSLGGRGHEGEEWF